jgi:hypothetical protein
MSGSGGTARGVGGRLDGHAHGFDARPIDQADALRRRDGVAGLEVELDRGLVATCGALGQID